MKFVSNSHTHLKKVKKSERLDVFLHEFFLGKFFSQNNFLRTFYIKSFSTFFLHQLSLQKLPPFFPGCCGGVLSGLPVLRAPDASARSTSVRLVVGNEATKWDVFYLRS